MNKLEHRLHAAAEETRQIARQHQPAPLVEKTEPTRHGLAVFAAAFAVVITIFGVVPWLMGDPENAPVAETSPTTAVETPSTVTTVGVSCSATGIALPSANPELPEPVAETRAAIIEAASNCDYAGLEHLAADGFNTSFGGGGVENLERWERSGEGRLGILLQLLDTSYSTTTYEDAGTFYEWPAAASYDTWDEIPDDQMAELELIYTREELDLIAEFGAYAGWRTGIDQDGNWLYFVAGD